MTLPILTYDNFLANPDAVRQSAIASGFGSWRPTKGAIGSSVYDGLNYKGDHATIIETIYNKVGFIGFPNCCLFRVTNEDTERAYVHSDIGEGDTTVIVYLSQHDDKYGTGFFKNKRTGSFAMSPLSELVANPIEFETTKAEINSSTEKEWEEVEFVQGEYNRAVAFKSHRWHRRFPEHGFSKDIETGRMIWIGHFQNPKLGVS